MLKKIIIFVFAAIIVFSLVCLLGQEDAVDVVWAQAAEVTGWAWIGADCANPVCTQFTNPIGWISFNCSNTGSCGAVDYKVSADYGAAAADTITGAAWIGGGNGVNGIGWIDFEDNGTPNCGAGNLEGYPTQFCQEAQTVDMGGTYEIQGWAPIISKDENGNPFTLTWIQFKSSGTEAGFPIAYSTVINSDGTIASGASDHYAWAGHHNDGGLGWIDMNPTGNGVIFPPSGNQPPIADATIDSGTVAVDSITINPGDNVSLHTDLDGGLGGSHDPDAGDAIVLFEWDWEDDGTYDVSCGGSPVNCNQVRAYNNSAVTRLRVTDNSGSQDTDTVVINVTGVCGDGSVDVGEECDDGNLIDGDGCSSACEIEGSGFNWNWWEALPWF